MSESNQYLKSSGCLSLGIAHPVLLTRQDENTHIWVGYHARCPEPALHMILEFSDSWSICSHMRLTVQNWVHIVRVCVNVGLKQTVENVCSGGRSLQNFVSLSSNPCTDCDPAFLWIYTVLHTCVNLGVCSMVFFRHIRLCLLQLTTQGDNVAFQHTQRVAQNKVAIDLVHNTDTAGNDGLC